MAVLLKISSALPSWCSWLIVLMVGFDLYDEALGFYMSEIMVVMLWPQPQLISESDLCPRSSS